MKTIFLKLIFILIMFSFSTTMLAYDATAPPVKDFGPGCYEEGFAVILYPRGIIVRSRPAIDSPRVGKLATGTEIQVFDSAFTGRYCWLNIGRNWIVKPVNGNKWVYPISTPTYMPLTSTPIPKIQRNYCYVDRVCTNNDDWIQGWCEWQVDHNREEAIRLGKISQAENCSQGSNSAPPSESVLNPNPPSVIRATSIPVSVVNNIDTHKSKESKCEPRAGEHSVSHECLH